MNTKITTKKAALDYLAAHMNDSTLQQSTRDRITLILSESKRYKLSDFLNVIRDIEITLNSAPAPAPVPAPTVETAKKPLSKAKKPKATATVKPTAPAPAPAPAKPTTNKQFPEIIAAFAPLKRADDINTFEDLRKAILDEKRELFFAFSWSSKELKKYEYTSIQCIRHPAKFEFNLDFASILHVSDDKPLAIALSVNTEAPYLIRDDELERDSESHMRFSNAIQFEIYESVKPE